MAERKGIKARLFNRSPRHSQGHSSQDPQPDQRKQAEKSVLKKVISSSKSSGKANKDDPRYREEQERQQGAMNAGNTFLDYYEKIKNPQGKDAKEGKDEKKKRGASGQATECDKRGGQGKDKKRGKVQTALRVAKLLK